MSDFLTDGCEKARETGECEIDLFAAYKNEIEMNDKGKSRDANRSHTSSLKVSKRNNINHFPVGYNYIYHHNCNKKSAFDYFHLRQYGKSSNEISFTDDYRIISSNLGKALKESISYVPRRIIAQVYENLLEYESDYVIREGKNAFFRDMKNGNLNEITHILHGGFCDYRWTCLNETRKGSIIDLFSLYSENRI